MYIKALTSTLLVFSVMASGSLTHAQTSNKHDPSVKKFLARCSVNDKRVIYKDKETDKWCGFEIDGFCRASRISIALAVCNKEYTQALIDKKSAQQETVEEGFAKAPAPLDIEPTNLEPANTEQESSTPSSQKKPSEQSAQIALQLELLEIEQKQLDLKKRQLDLIKEEKRLKTKIDNTLEN